MMKSRLMALLAALAMLTAMVVVTGCGSDDDDGGSGGGENGTLSVGSDIPYPPFEFGDPPDYEGFDIDVINEIGDRLGMDVEIQATKFDTIFNDLKQGKFDVVISASTITDERLKVVDFSAPYYDAEQALIVKPGSDIETVEDLAGKTVAAQNGTTGKDFAEQESDAGQVDGFDLGPDVINAVKGGQVDAGILDIPVAQDAIDKGEEGFEIATSIPTGELYGIAVAKDNKDLLDQINEALAGMKEDGTLNEIYQEWFKRDATEAVLNAEADGGSGADPGADDSAESEG